jgi:hypothetical protein
MLNSLTIPLKHIWLSLIVALITTGCSEVKEEIAKEEATTPSAFENVLEESKDLLLLIKNDLLIMGHSNIEPYVASNGLSPEKNSFRSEISFGEITLKKVYKCKNNIISAVHYDFYYDSLNMELNKNTNTILKYLKQEFGDYSSTHVNRTMKVCSWIVSGNTLDYELFKNGFTFTIRKNQTTEKAIEIVVVLPTHLELTEKLIQGVYSDSLKLGLSIMADIQNLFKVRFKSKSNTLAFSETYNENVLLSGSFLFKGENLSGTYFDYVYLDTIPQSFVSDAIIVKSIITELYGAPSDVATVPLSTSYKWGNSPIVLDVYGDGFSIILEKDRL